MSKNMYGLPNHIYLVLGGFKYTSDPNGLIANVLDEHAPALEFQRCMDEDAWLTLQAAHPSAGGITQLTVGPEEGERRGLDARVNIEKLHPSPVPRLVDAVSARLRRLRCPNPNASTGAGRRSSLTTFAGARWFRRIPPGGLRCALCSMPGCR
jgi:hypothetical protein